MTLQEKELILSTLERLDDFVVGAEHDNSAARSYIKAIATTIKQEKTSPFDYELRVTALCNAIRELSDAYGDFPVYNDYINKAIRNTCDALHSLETLRGLCDDD